MGYLDNNGLAHLWAALKTALNGKQEKLTGTPGQLVGFDEGGNAVPQSAGDVGVATMAQVNDAISTAIAGAIEEAY